MSARPQYDASYYQVGCGELPYERNEGWLKFFAGLAEQIIISLQPRCVLDAGCAMGFLVEALRDRQVEAFGVDISPYAIAQVREDLRSFCWVSSVSEPLPRKYDLIVCIEVLEHMPAAEAEQAVANFCLHADDVLFSSSPFDYTEASHINLHPPEYWAELFARHGFIRDLEFDASFITPWAMRFRRSADHLPRVIRHYERHLWQVQQENRELRASALEMRRQLALAVSERDRLASEQTVTEVWRARAQVVEASLAERGLRWFDALARRVAPRETLRGHLYDALLAAPHSLFRRAERQVDVWGQHRIEPPLAPWLLRASRLMGRRFVPASVLPPTLLLPITVPVDIIVCVHNALDDLQRCLNAIVRYTRSPYRLILVDDGSDDDCARYLVGFAREQAAVLLRNETPLGYTRAANRGLRESRADLVLLLNSDTEPTPDWLDRMVACATSDQSIGVVGPLSNTASWQSIPDVLDEATGDWSKNSAPQGMNPADIAYSLAAQSARLYPRLPFLNGFCLLIKRVTLESVGLFDEVAFGEGYGEENDFCLRARAKGWQLALADDTYVHHVQSRSYTDAQRQRLSEQAQSRLANKHGLAVITQGVETLRSDRVLEGIRARSRVLYARDQLCLEGRALWEGRRILCLLPVRGTGGGANVIIQEAEAMRRMGVDVTLVTLAALRQDFERGYPDLTLPTRYVDEPQAVGSLAACYDAVLATQNMSVDWMAWPASMSRRPVRAYYVQDFEPWFFPPDSEAHARARRSYTAFPDLVRLTKTEWTRTTVLQHAGVECHVTGPSVDIDLHRPRPRRDGNWPKRPLRIAAMIRPESPRRAAHFTMEVLRDIWRQHGRRVEIILFGCAAADSSFRALPRDFRWHNVGALHRTQMAFLLNEVDIFADFSKFQAMGLTALEAMACGCAVIVPQEGGATSFARSGENCLVVDTKSSVAARQALHVLVTDHELRLKLQRASIQQSVQYFPEQSAVRLLAALFTQDRK